VVTLGAGRRGARAAHRYWGFVAFFFEKKNSSSRSGPFEAHRAVLALRAIQPLSLDRARPADMTGSKKTKSPPSWSAHGPSQERKKTKIPSTVKSANKKVIDMSGGVGERR